MKHMTIDERRRIEFLAGLGYSVPRIARDLGRHPSTIRNELIAHRVDSDKGRGCSNRLCADFDECARTVRSASGTCRRRSQRRCFGDCPDFREASCHRLARPPFVCNGCRDERSCPMAKKFYIAPVAQDRYESERSLSRTGVRPDAETLARMDAVLSPCVRRGQSPAAVIAAHPGLFGEYGVSTVYGWIGDGLFSAKTHDLPFAGTRRKPRKRPQTKTDAKCRIGRTHGDMAVWLANHADQSVTCELDTVVGSVSGKVLFTMILLETGLSIAFLKERKTSQTCTRVFNALWDAAGPGLFRELFANILTDNGAEFSDPGMIENFRPDPGHNPTKTLPRGVRVWFADPYCPSQKPHVERFHNELRRILTKGASFNPLTQEKVNAVVSNLNSYPREATGWKAPYDLFVGKHGEPGRAFLDRLGIVRVPSGQVTLLPILLGESFQRSADRAILKRNGVSPARPQAE